MRLGLRRSCRFRLCYQRAVHLCVVLVVEGGLRVRAYLLVEHFGFLADEDPPGPGSHSVEDDGRRPRRVEPLALEFISHSRDRLAQVIGGEVFGQQAHPDENGPRNVGNLLQQFGVAQLLPLWQAEGAAGGLGDVGVHDARQTCGRRSTRPAS